MSSREEKFEKQLSEFTDFKFDTVFGKLEMYESYENYANAINHKKLMLGFNSIDAALGGLRPSEVVTIVAGTNIGKSAFAMNVMYNATKNSDGLIILFSLEMSETDIFERYIQMEFDMYTFEVENIFVKNDKVSKQKILERIDKHRNIISVIKRININEIVPYIKTIEQIEGKECAMIIIDHIGLIVNDKYRDSFQRTEDTMIRLKEISLHTKLPVMLFSQTSRSDIKSLDGLTLHSGKNSGEVENSSQIVFTLEKLKNVDPNIIDETTIAMATTTNDRKATIDILKLTTQKKKRGEYGDAIIIFNRKNLRMTEYENNNYKIL